MTALALYQPAIDQVCRALPAENSRKAYSQSLARFFAWHTAQGGGPLNRDLVLRYREDLVAGGKQAPTVNQALAAIKKLAKEALYAGLLDPLSERGIADTPTLPVHGHRLKRWLTVEQLAALLQMPDRNTPQGRRDYALLCLLSLAALRREEAATLTCEDLHRRDTRMVLEVKGKGGRIRTVICHKLLEEAIEEWQVYDGVLQGRLLRRFDNGGICQSLTADGIRKICDAYAARFEVRFTPHDLRRTAARIMRSNGAEYDQIQHVLGHSSVTTTERYVRMMPDTAAPATDRISLVSPVTPVTG